jgi:hypothetical protein
VLGPRDFSIPRDESEAHVDSVLKRGSIDISVNGNGPLSARASAPFSTQEGGSTILP